MSSLQPYGHWLPEDVKEQAEPAPPLSKKGKSSLPSVVLGTQGRPWTAVPNPMLCSPSDQQLCLFTPLLWSRCLRAHPGGIQLLVPPRLHVGPQPPSLHR